MSDADLHSIEGDENLNFTYSFRNQTGHIQPEENSTSVQLNSSRPADSSFQLNPFSDSTVVNSSKKHDRSSQLDLKAGQKNGRRGKPSSALLQAKMNARKQKADVNPSSPPVVIKDHLQPARDSKDSIRKDTGVVYDMRMVEHRNLWEPTHPECPERFSSIIQRCHALGLLDRCHSIPPRFANPIELLPLHTVEHIERLREICEMSDLVRIEEISSQYEAVYFHPSTYELALLACGSTIDLVRNIVDGKIHNGMAIVRPPGHHAMKEEYCGYCYFNNVAVAAKQLLDTSSINRILILDFDVHHGQSTQQMFYDDPRVLYFSIHRFEHGMYWPNLEESNYNWIGADAGIGFNCNIPLNATGLGNMDYLSVWHKILLPMSYQFSPDFVIVSAGFDAALGCPEGEMTVTPQCYPHLIWLLMGLANGKIAVILEGGYCLKSLAEGAALTLRALLGDPCPLISPISNPSTVIVDTILNATAVLKNSWDFGVARFVDEEEFKKKVEFGEGHNPTYRFDWTEPKTLKNPTKGYFNILTAATAEAVDKELDRLIFTTSLTVAKHRVGLVYDDIMLTHRHINLPHPECPERISNIFACHVSYGLVERCHRIESRKATTDELRLIHAEQHILKMKNSQRLGSNDLCKLEERYNSIYLNSNSYECALHAAGSILNVVDNVLSGTCQSGVAIVRPPGHHAEMEEACGFCLFNNVALAAKYAIENYDLKRILIIDWDVHHGNGIQHIFEKDPRVLYISLHRYDHGSFFPGSKDANFRAVGSGPGEGFNVNIPWNRKGMGDTEYFTAFTNIVLPIAYEYAPELVLVSAGFDAAQGDPLGGCKISPEGYAHMTHLLTSLANGKIILALEGGYNLTSISYSMSLCTKTLLGDPIPPLTLNPTVDESALESIRDVLETHSIYWKVLEPFRRVLPSMCPVKLGKYTVATTTSDEVTQLMEKLEVEERKSPGVDFNLNPTQPPMSMIPDPPISAGEPSLSLPSAPLPTNIQRLNQTATVVVPVTDNSSVGGGESARGRAANVITRVEAAAEAATPIAIEELEGAIGGSNNIHDLSIEFSLGDEGFQVVPLRWCPHLETVNPVPANGIDVLTSCGDCDSIQENWICLTCYAVKCSRYVREHMLNHYEETGHSMVLSFTDLSVWCFRCECYVHCLELFEAKHAAYSTKFGESLDPATFN